MELPSKGNVPGESHRFIVAVIAAAVFHVLFFATWSFLPFARAEPMTAVPLDAEPPPLEVQFVAPPPEPAPAPPEPPEPEPAKPEPVPAVENVITALKETDPEPAPVVEEPPPSVEAPKPVPRPPAKEPSPPQRQLQPQPKPVPKPVAVRKPRPAPAKRTAIVPRPQAAVASAPTPPSYRSNPKPSYPAEAKRQRMEGTTFLKVEVLASGNVGTVTVLKSSGNRLLDQSASSTVQNSWRFRPATRAGQPISTFVTVPIRFTLR